MKLDEFTRIPAVPSLVDAMRSEIGSTAVQQCLDQVGLKQAMIEAPDAALPMRHLFGLFESFARRRGDANFGLFAGDVIRADSFGILTLYTMQGSDLLSAMKRGNRAWLFHQSCGSFDLSVGPVFTEISYKVHLPLSVGRHHHAVHVLIQVVKLYRYFLAGHKFEVSQVGLEADRYGDPYLLESTFGAPVCFSADTNYIRFPSEFLNVRPTRRGLGLETLTYSDLLRYSRQRPPRKIATKVERFLLQSLTGDVSADSASRFLNIGTRTLQRMLAREGLTFHEVLENVKRQRASELIAETRLPLGDVSRMLGYSEPAHFTRAFRRWNGMSPSKFRSGDSSL